MAEIVLNKEERQWNKQLTQHLQRYSYIRDWSELAAWLSKLKNYLHDRKGPVCQKEALLKRLSSSLNGALPVALHESTLEIYQMLFSQSIITNDELIITCIGLFSFFPQANLKNKCKMVQIFNKYLPLFGKDLQLLATGLTITILPALNQMHEPIIRDIVNLFDVLAKPQYIGQEFVSEAIWVAILRSANCRVAGLKFFSMKLGKGIEEEQNDEEQNFWNQTTILSKRPHEEAQQKFQKQQQIHSNTKLKDNEGKDLLKQFCPNIQTLVINAIAICIQDSNTLAIKAGLDFLYKYLPLKTDALSDTAKLNLTKSVVWLMGKRDTSVTRKINLWLFGKPDNQNKYSINQKQLYFITSAIIIFLTEGGSLEPLKITMNILSQHEQLPNLILRDLVRNIVSFCQSYEGNIEMFKQVSKLMYRFFDRMKSSISIVCQSLSESVIEAIENKKFDEAQQNVNLSIFFLTKLIKQQEINLVIQPFLSMLLQALLLTHWQNKLFMKSSLLKLIDIMDKYKDKFKEIQINNQNIDMLTRFNQLFSRLIELAIAHEFNENFEQQIHLMNKVMSKIYQVFGIYNQEWVSNVIKNIALNNPAHFLSAIEIVGQMMEKECEFKNQIILRAEDVSKNNCIKVCLAKIWGILSLGHLQIRIIPHLLRIIKYFHGFFEKLLQHQFQVSGQIAIIKFRLFWQVAPKYPHIMGSQQVEEVSKFGLFKMLQFLDSGNPLVKYHSHLWISETFPAYHRVLNPILEIMLKPKQCWYQTPQGQFVYAVLPQTAKILQALRYLRSFIRLVPQKFNKYIFKPLTIKILPYYQMFKGQDPSSQIHQIPYITPLLEIVVRCTETKFVGGDNKGIDLAACQLLEVFVRIIATSELSNYFLARHFKDILRSLHFATINEQHLLQIQLLNLLKLIFNYSSIKKLADHKILKESIINYNLIGIILQGVSCNFPYIKQQFVSFLSQCIPLLLQHDQSCGQVISRVLNTYTNKIAYVNSKKVQASSLKDLQISQKNAEILILFDGVKDLLSLFLNLHLKPFEKEKNQHDTDYGLFSFYSWKSYISLKIDKKPDLKFKRIHEEISKQIINELPSLIAIMAACWTITELKPYYGIHKQGLTIFNYESFLQYNKALNNAQNRLETQQSVQAFIISLLRVLLNTNPGETMKAILNCWATANKDVQTKLKLLELLVFSGLPIQIFYSILNDSFNPEKMNRKRKGIVLQCDKNSEQDILQFCQAFSHYNFQNPSFFQNHNLISIWMSFCKFVKVFDGARNAITLYNLLELIDLFLNKNNPKEILRQQKIKKEITAIHNAYNDLVHIISGKLKIQPPNQIIKIVNLLPFPSSIYQLRVSTLIEDNRLNNSYALMDECNHLKMPQYIRLMGLTLTKRLAYNFLLTLHNQAEVVLAKKVRQLIVCVLPLVQQKSNSSPLVEGASELVLSLLEQKRQLYVKEVKNEILQIFNKQDFFICSSKTLQSWAKIIDLLIDNSKQHDLFVEYLQKVSLASSLFSSYTFETKKKIKSFERICFILYAGKKDKYNDKAQLLIDKIIEVIKHSDVPQPVLILIFFCIRILILRFTQEKITKLLSTLWQMIIFLLNNIFSEAAQKQKLNLHWAALKLIQMISLMQISEFHAHQWIFFYDYVGVKFLKPNKNLEGMRVISTLLQPKIHKYLPQGLILNKEQIGEVQQKRHLIIKEDKIDDIDLLKTKALLLSSYLISSNGCKMLFDIREVEQLIDNDFLNLDQFIFKVK